MSTNVLKQMEQRAKEAEELIVLLRTEMSELKEKVIKASIEKETSRLQSENENLQKDIETWKQKLVQLEIQNGVKQIALPGETIKEASQNIQNIRHSKHEQVSPDPALISPKSDPKNIVEKTAKADKKAKKAKSTSDANTKTSVDERAIDVSRLDFRIGKILNAKKHPDADALYVEEIDVGEEKTRTVVSGLVKHVPLEEMQNRIVVLLCNLKPAKMRGVLSEAMVMCASTPDKVEILVPPSGCVPGDTVCCCGYAGEPDKELNPKKKIFEQVAPDLKTDVDLRATYKGVPLEVDGKGIVMARSLCNVQIK